MNLEVRELHCAEKEIDAIKKLYKSAFPKNERMPFWIFKKGIKKASGCCLTFYCDSFFAGFAYLLISDELVYLFYLAVDGIYRSKGIGSSILAYLKSVYKQPIALDIEALDENAVNAEVRKKRKAFYLRNGFSDTGERSSFNKVRYETLCSGKLSGGRKAINILLKRFFKKSIFF